MADELKTEKTEKTGGDGVTPKTLTQEEVDRIVVERLAREKAKYADYEEIKRKAETLEAENKAAREKEMSDLQKAQAKLKEYEEQVNGLKPFKERWDKYELETAAQIEIDSKDLSDEQKAIVAAIPDMLIKQKTIREFKSQKKTAGDWGKGGPGEKEIEFAEIEAKRKRGDATWAKDYQKYREKIGRI